MGFYPSPFGHPRNPRHKLQLIRSPWTATRPSELSNALPWRRDRWVYANLIGGFNPSEKYESQTGSSSQLWGK